MAGNRAGYFRVYGISAGIVFGLWAYAALQGSAIDGPRALYPGPDFMRVQGPAEGCENSMQFTGEFAAVADVAE